MIDKDPVKEIEQIVHDVHDIAGRHTKPTLSKYPLLFAFLLVFSVASVLQGFDMLVGSIPFFHQHPVSLIIVGVTTLVLTGTLYETLERMK